MSIKNFLVKESKKSYKEFSTVKLLLFSFFGLLFGFVGTISSVIFLSKGFNIIGVTIVLLVTGLIIWQGLKWKFPRYVILNKFFSSFFSNKKQQHFKRVKTHKKYKTYKNSKSFGYYFKRMLGLTTFIFISVTFLFIFVTIVYIIDRGNYKVLMLSIPSYCIFIALYFTVLLIEADFNYKYGDQYKI